MGSDPASDEARELAGLVGAHLGLAGAVLVCGGLGGVMEAACEGVRGHGGTAIGLLPGLDRREGNAQLDIVIPTGMGEMRNALVVRAVDVLIAVGGEFGTLSEIALALKTGTPVVGLGTWELMHPEGRPDQILRAETAEEAVALALEAAERQG